MNQSDLRRLLFETLTSIGLWSANAEELLVAIAAHESAACKYIYQMNDGPARGIFQQEKLSHDEIFTILFPTRQALRYKVMDACNFLANPSYESLASNTGWAIIACRLHFLRFKDPIPDASDIESIANYWKKYWNTSAGKGTIEEFINDYNLLISGNR